MKKRWLTDASFVLGLAALVLRRWLYVTAVDEKGLLPRLHPLSLGLLALTAAALVLIYVTVRKQEESRTCGDCRASGLSALLGPGAMALGILLTVRTGTPGTAGYLGTAWLWLGMASSVCLLAAGAAAFCGKKPFFLLHMVPCLFFVVHIVSHYQTWSGNPQMLDYLFALLGAMALMFFCFYTSALEAGCGSRRMMLGMGLAAVYLCLAELGNSAYPVLYLCGVLWIRAELFHLRAED